MKQQISTPKDLLTAICNELGCNETKIKSKVRKRELVTVRHIYAYIGKIYFYFTLMSLGDALGKRDHTTIISSINSVRNFVKSKDALVCEMLAIVMDSLGLAENDKKNYQHLQRQHTELTNAYNSLKLKYANLCADNKYLEKKISNLETQIKLYKTNALVV